MFLNLAMLAGIGAAVIPLVIHLLARARHREVEWGAMMFLEGAAAPQSHAARLKQWFLLGLRMVMVGVLAGALARPILRSGQGGGAGDAPASVVIVLDQSFSMGCEEAGRTRFDKAREAVLQILAGLRKGDEVALVLAGERVESRDPTSNLQTVAREVAEIQVSGGAADFADAIIEAQRLLARMAKPNREIYIVCDRQAGSWQRLLAEPQHARWLNDPRTPARCSIVPVGGEEGDNVAVMSLDLAESVAVRNHPAEVEIGLRNFGTSPRVGMDLALSVTNPWGAVKQIKTLPVTIPGGGQTAIRIPVTFEQGGSHVVAAHINAPGLEADNRLESAIDVIEPVEVLIASGSEVGTEIRRESFFLRLALAPFKSGQKRGADPAVVTIKSVEEWPAADLGKYHVIILANLPQITADQARALEQRVYEGAGLIIAPGNLVRVDNFNAMLYRDGQGLSPARLDAPVSADGSEATGLLGMELTHPIFRFRRGTDPLPGAVIGRYFPVNPRPADARVLGTYSSGRPFLIEGPRGRARVLLVTTPLDADWNMMPLYPFYLPFVQSMVRYAAAPALPPRNLLPGQALLASFEAAVEEVRLERGGERLRDIAITGGGTQVRFEDTTRPGVYRLSARLQMPGNPTRILHYTVAAPREESDLSPLLPEQWNQLRAMSFGMMNPAQEAISRSVASQRSGSELWLPLLLAAIGLGLCEQFLARWWGREAA